jgi:hypothetical protein
MQLQFVDSMCAQAHGDIARAKFWLQRQQQVHKLRDLPELTDTVGPEGGFRLRYTLVRKEVSPDTARATGRGGAYVQTKRVEFIPIFHELGEPVEVALAEGSDFRRALPKIHPGQTSVRTTVTIWLYPDSFDAFRQIRKELYRLGHPVAARPLPPDTPIAWMPEGSKSAAQ